MIVVGGTLDGKRAVFPEMPADNAIIKYYYLKRRGYSKLTMTDANNGHDYDVGKIFSSVSEKSQ